MNATETKFVAVYQFQFEGDLVKVHRVGCAHIKKMVLDGGEVWETTESTSAQDAKSAAEGMGYTGDVSDFPTSFAPCVEVAK